MRRKASITFEVNGSDRTLVVEPRTTLLQALREECALTGTQGSCASGVCGACTVLLDGEPMRACTVFAVQVNGKAVETVESLSSGQTLHPLQRAFVAAGAVQCGYCTPGFLMLALGALRHDPLMDEAAIRELVSANLCRCQDYQPIVSAIIAAQRDFEASEE